MKQPIVIIGMGEMAGVFARGFLRAGHPVFPVTRKDNIDVVAKQLPDPALVLVAIAEGDLDQALTTIPTSWRDRIVLLQNELLPRDWHRHQLRSPTVISVWFEKKPCREYKVIIPSPVSGPHAQIVTEALGTLSIPTRIIDQGDDMLYELVRKNVYILTTNIAGLKAGGTVSQLWSDHEDLARAVASDVIAIQEWLTDTSLDYQRLLTRMIEAFVGDPDHGCMGRSAPARLQRALQLAHEAGIAVPTLQEISQQTGE